ncbi:hypothetical protein HA402_013034 [Bradysia odoriphaga]|nr:hypothetical protein HA402_013034 [Bradysia odoriphaga]
MNQDCLENFFGNIRSCCHNAKSLIVTHFRSAFTTVFMTNTIAHSVKSNCEPDIATPLLTDINHLLKNNMNQMQDRKSATENSHKTPNNNDILCFQNSQPDYSSSLDFENNDVDWQNIDPIIFDPEFSDKELSAIDEQAIFDLSKTVFDKLLKSTLCDECLPFLETSSNESLSEPSDVFTLNFRKIISNIEESLEFICAESGLKRKVINSLQSVKLDKMGCNDHFGHVEKNFKEYSTVFGIILFCIKVNNILNRKNKDFSQNFNLVEKLAFNFRKKKRIGKYSEKFDKQL